MFRTNNQIKTKNNHTEITGNKQIISISNLIILILITKNIIVTKTLFDKMTLLNPTQTRFFHYSKKTQLKKSSSFALLLWLVGCFVPPHMCTRMSTTLRFNSSFSDWNWVFGNTYTIHSCMIEEQCCGTQKTKNTHRISQDTQIIVTPISTDALPRSHLGNEWITAGHRQCRRWKRKSRRTHVSNKYRINTYLPNIIRVYGSTSQNRISLTDVLGPSFPPWRLRHSRRSRADHFCPYVFP